MIIWLILGLLLLITGTIIFGKDIIPWIKKHKKAFLALILGGVTITGGLIYTSPIPEPPAGDEWISPTSYTDHDSQWTTETNAYDGNTGTDATATVSGGPGGNWGGFCSFILDSAITSSKVQYYIGTLTQTASGINEIDVDVSNGGAVWTDVYEGAFTTGSYIEKSFAESTRDRCRVRFHNSNSLMSKTARLAEIQMWEVATEDTTPPSITITFAGNSSDDGGPLYQPPLEATTTADDGYYTNSSYQHEGYINIVATITDDSGLDSVYLHWVNETNGVTTWYNSSTLSDQGDDVWAIVTSFPVANATVAGSNYSFDIFATDSSDNSNTNIVFWNKTGVGGSNTRRWVQLNCTAQNISYEPYYMLNSTYRTGSFLTYGSGDENKADRLLNDQGPDGSWNDTGYLANDTLTDDMNQIWCSAFAGHWFADDVCAQNMTVTEPYVHTWLHFESVNFQITFGKKRGAATLDNTGWTITKVADSLEDMLWDGCFRDNKEFNLFAGYVDITDFSFQDNDVYEAYFHVCKSAAQGYPSVICNQSVQSFIIWDVPSDIKSGSDNSTDTDGDGLSDYVELNTTWGSYTNPFVADTDNDGYTDYAEYYANTEANNNTDRPSGITLSFEAKYATGNTMWTTPALGDIDDDDDMEIVIGDIDEDVSVLYHDGSTITKEDDYNTNGNVDAHPTLIDIDGDDEIEILIANAGTRFYIFNHSGTTISLEDYYEATELLGNEFKDCSPAVADIDRDGNYEIAIGNFGNDVMYVFNYSDGDISNESIFVCEDGFLYTSTVANLDDDAEIEIIGPNEAPLVYVFEHNGIDLIEESNFSDLSHDAYQVSVADVDKDGVNEIIVPSEDDNVYILHSTGSSLVEEDNFTTDGNAKAAAIADIDDDGTIEIVVGGGGYVYVLSHDGSTITEEDNYNCGTVSGPVSISDLNNDGTLEFLVCANQQLQIFTHDGSDISLVSACPIFFSAITTPVVADIDDDGITEVVVANCGDPNGNELYVFGTHGTNSADNDWTEQGYNHQKTGSLINRHPLAVLGESPTNGTIDVQTNPTVAGIVDDLDGDTLNVTWYSNSSGAWIQFGDTNTSVSGNTNVTQVTSNFSDGNTQYWWSMNVSDGEGGWKNKTFTFTTIGWSNSTSEITINSPLDNSGQISPVNLSATVADPEGDTMNISFYGDSSHLFTHSNKANGTYYYDWTINGGYHNWYVIVNDSFGNSNTSDSNFFWVNYNNDTFLNEENISSTTNLTYNSKGWYTVDESGGGGVLSYLIRNNSADTTEIAEGGSITYVNYDNEVKSEGSDITYNAGEFTLATGKYLVMYNDYFYTADTTANERVQGLGGIFIDEGGGYKLLDTGHSGYYIRKANGDQECFPTGASIIDITTSTDMKIGYWRLDATTSGSLNRIANYAGISILKLDDTWNYGRYNTSAQDNACTLNTWEDIINLQVVEEDTGFSLSGSDITISDAGKYLVAYTVKTYDADGRTEGVFRLTLDDTEVEGSHVSMYNRDYENDNDGATSWVGIINVSTDDVLNFQAYETDGTLMIDTGTSIEIVKLPDTAETFRATTSNVDMNPASLTELALSTEEFISEDTFTFSASNSYFEVDSDATYLVMASVQADAGGVARAKPAGQFSINDVVAPWCIGGRYNRDSGADEVGYCIGALFDLTNGDDISMEVKQYGNSGSITVDHGSISALKLGFYEGNITSISKNRSDTGTWDKFYAQVNNTANSTFKIINATTGADILTGLSDGSDISSVNDQEIKIFGSFDGAVNFSSWNVSWAATAYSTTIRTNGIDYFVWLGGNTTMSGVAENFTGYTFNGDDEISKLADDGTWVDYTSADQGGGDDVSVYTFDVIKSNLEDNTGELSFDMTENSDYSDNYENRTFYLKKISNGYNYTGFSSVVSSDLGTEADAMSMSNGYFIGVWDNSTYEWIFHIQGTPINTNQAVDLWDVCITKISTDRTWDQS